MYQITVTQKAANIFKEMILSENMPLDTTYLHVGAKSGGCSGYKFTLDTTKDILSTDVINKQHDITIIADSTTVEEIIGDIEIDYHDKNLVEQGFVFKRVSSNYTCGCGESFTAMKDIA
tara:strand:- start:201 stop:557 length:357 start_codon:yes stop_codon:yes gene_type:complete